MPNPRTSNDGTRTSTLVLVPWASTVAHTPATPARLNSSQMTTSRRPSRGISGRPTNEEMMMPTISGLSPSAARDALRPRAFWKNSDRT